MYLFHLCLHDNSYRDGCLGAKLVITPEDVPNMAAYPLMTLNRQHLPLA